MSDLEEIVEKLRLRNIGRHIFLCADQTNPKCAPREAGMESWDYLKKRLKELGLTKATRPKGSFLFLGPTGVGKTETARALAQ